MTARGCRGSKPRCLVCGLKPETCVCAALPRVHFATPVAIVQHLRERFKPTNTGRLFARMVESTIVLPCGMREPAFDPSPLQDPAIEWCLLFPKDGAPVLDPLQRPADGRRLGFVVLDGAWSQCNRMRRRLPVISDLPCHALPPGPPSFWTVRTQQRREGRSTFEAILDALALVEDPTAVSALRRSFADVTARVLHLKGKLPSPEIPAGWAV